MLPSSAIITYKLFVTINVFLRLGTIKLIVFNNLPQVTPICILNYILNYSNYLFKFKIIEIIFIVKCRL